MPTMCGSKLFDIYSEVTRDRSWVRYYLNRRHEFPSLSTRYELLCHLASRVDVFLMQSKLTRCTLRMHSSVTRRRDEMRSLCNPMPHAPASVCARCSSLCTWMALRATILCVCDVVPTRSLCIRYAVLTELPPRVDELGVRP